MASYKHYPSRPAGSSWRVYHRGKSYWLPSEAEAKAKCAELEGRGGRTFGARELEEYRHAREVLGDVPLMVAVRAYMEHLSGESGLTVAELAKRHLAHATGRAEYLTKKRYFVGKLTARLGSRRVADIRPSDIEEAVRSFDSPWMANTYLAHVRVLFRYGVKLRLSRNDPTAGLTDRKVNPSKVILSVADAQHMAKICAEHFPDILPAVALQLYTGIRTSEVCRLQWSAVRVGEFVDVSPNVSKTHERRVIDYWPKVLTRYIAAGSQRVGPVVPKPASYEARKNKLVVACKAAKPDFVFGQNAPRHSFASYAVALFQDAGRVALLMGQRDVNILFRHYRNYRTRDEGRAYFEEA